ncbi:hypothetical protein AAF712_010554 [Marasmius tenuissimus]|uniref:Uncharacterized protein n=1 Tax=Marasmius tenuissimus TaxID=585030 RepID=A0ABR2ZMS2_9AGAR
MVDGFGYTLAQSRVETGRSGVDSLQETAAQMMDRAIVLRKLSLHLNGVEFLSQNRLVAGVMWTRGINIVSPISFSFCNIVDLVIRSRKEDVCDLIGFMCSFPVLETLSVTCTSITDTERTVGTPHTRVMTYLPESLRTIHLDTYLHPNSTADEVFTNWITLHSPRQINHVALLSVFSAQINPPNPHNRHVGHISCYVGSCRSTEGGQIHEIDGDVFDLSKLAALRSLGIHARDDFNTGISPVRMFIQMLGRPPPRLAKVSLVLDYRGALQAQESRIEDWKELDILLASELYAKVFMKVYLGLRIGANGLEDLAWYDGTTERDFKDFLCRCIELQRVCFFPFPIFINSTRNNVVVNTGIQPLARESPAQKTPITSIPIDVGPNDDRATSNQACFTEKHPGSKSVSHALTSDTRAPSSSVRYLWVEVSVFQSTLSW